MPADRDLFDEENQMVAMSFGDHIEELRVRLVLALLGLAVGVVITLVPPLNLGFHVMHGMMDPAEVALNEFREDLRVKKSAAALVAETFSPMVIRIPADDLIRALAEAAPELGLKPKPKPSVPTTAPKVLTSGGSPGSLGAEPSPGAVLAEQARMIELPMEMRDAEVITLVGENSERSKALVSLTPMETPFIFFTVCLVAGLVFASPWVFYQLWAFIAAGLYMHERKYVYRFLPFSLGLFLAGVLLAYFGVLPLTLRFILQFNLWTGVEPNLTLSSWMGFATILPLVFGLGFQTPLVMLFLAKLGILGAAEFRSKRKFAVLITVVAAAVLTPGPDVVSQLMLALPMLLLYELGIILVERGEKRAVAV
jgi:sec-independent protein translocase protein TatC